RRHRPPVGPRSVARGAEGRAGADRRSRRRTPAWGWSSMGAFVGELVARGAASGCRLRGRPRPAGDNRPDGSAADATRDLLDGRCGDDRERGRQSGTRKRILQGGPIRARGGGQRGDRDPGEQETGTHPESTGSTDPAVVL